MRFNPTLVLSSSALALTIGIASPAYAQDTQELPVCQEGQTENCQAPAAGEEAPASTASQVSQSAGEGTIVVTGTRINRPTLSSPVPLTSVTVDELTSKGDVSLGDALNDLPSLRTTFSQGNSTRFIGTAGLNLLDLRGLGTARTLVLVNGKRHVTASPGDYLVDTNTIPVDLLERVDVVTGGNSAVYGSDAVAGVVNFILKRDFEGITVKGQGGASQRGDRGSYFLSGTWGTNFADDRGNVAVSAEWAKSKPYWFKQRDDLTGAFSGRCQFNAVEPTGGEPFGTDGIFDTAFVCGVKNGSISDGGTVGRVGPGQYLRFDPQGNLYVDVPDGNFEAGGSANIIGGDGSTLRQTGQLSAGLERYAINVLSHYDIQEWLRPYVEAKYVRIKARQEGQPSFVASSSFNPIYRCTNPFLTAQALGMLQANGLCGAVGSTPTDAQTFPLTRFNVDFGGRGEKHKRTTKRIVAGIEGDFNEDWHYDISLNYGHLETRMRSLNNLVLRTVDGRPDGATLAWDAVRDPNTGQIVCRVNSTSLVQNPQGSADDRPDCVPINVFGYGQPSQAALDFVNTEAHRRERASEFVAQATVAGDLSQLFELPGGPVRWALGAEYRKEKARSEFDELTASGGTFLNAIQPFAPPKMTVKEAFGELDLPLLKDMPFAEELSVRGAARVSDYNTSVGTVWAWNIDGMWAPIRDLRFRAALATSVRAPTQTDLYSPLSQNFAFIADPCDFANINANPNRAANCAAGGVPTVFNAALVAACVGSSVPANQRELGDPFVNCTARTSSTSFLSGGNEDLVEERGKSLTLGMVVEPRFIPGLNFTVDYWRIRVKNLIAVLTAQTIINSCYDAPSLSNPFCATVNRDPTTGLFVAPAVLSGGVNFVSQKTQGLDFDLSYRHTFGNGHKLALRGIATYLLRLDNYTDPSNAAVPNRQMSELGDPRFAANFNANYDIGAFDLTYNLRYLGRQTVGTWESQHEFTGACPSTGLTGFSGRTCTPGDIVTLDPANLDQFPDKWIPDTFYHAMRLNWEVDNRFNFYAGVDNMFDKKPTYPQLGSTGIAAGEARDYVGRFFYAGFRVDY